MILKMKVYICKEYTINKDEDIFLEIDIHKALLPQNRDITFQ